MRDHFDFGWKQNRKRYVNWKVKKFGESIN